MSKIEKPVKKPTGYDMKDWADNDYLQENIDALVYCKDIRWEKYIEQSDKYWEQEMNKKEEEIADMKMLFVLAIKKAFPIEESHKILDAFYKMDFKKYSEKHS